MNLRMVLLCLSAAFVVWWIIENPSGASHLVHNTGVFLTSAADSIGSFFGSL